LGTAGRTGLEANRKIVRIILGRSWWPRRRATRAEPELWLRQDAVHAVSELRFVDGAILVLVAVGEKLLDARSQLGLGDDAILVRVENFQQRLGHEVAGTEAGRRTKTAGAALAAL